MFSEQCIFFHFALIVLQFVDVLAVVAQARSEAELDVATFFSASIWLKLGVGVDMLLKVLLLSKLSHTILALELFDTHMDGKVVPLQGVLI